MTITRNSYQLHFQALAAYDQLNPSESKQLDELVAEMVAPDQNVGMVELAMLSFEGNLNLVQGQGSRSSCKTSSFNHLLGLHAVGDQA